MAIYEYKCDECGDTFETWQKITDKPYTLCKQLRQGIIESNGLEDLAEAELSKEAKENNLKVPKKDCEGKVQKLISQSSFHLEGSGWYKDGYEGKSNKK